jgi:hypothetical protein
MLGVDPLSTDVATKLGVDLDGGMAVFSDELEPTLVVHLTAPDATRAFFAKRTAQPATVDGAQVFTAHAFGHIDVAWAIDRDWLFVHVAPTGGDTAWFTRSHHPHAQGWDVNWGFATKLGEQLKTKAGKLLGFVDPRALIEKLGKRAGAALACARVVEPIQRVGLALDGDLHHVDVRAAFDVGAHAADVQRAVLPPPPGWNAAFDSAPVAVELNLDLDSFQDWLQPCADLVNIDLRDAHRDGVRAVRLALASVDPDATWGSGALSADLRDTKPIMSLLDKIPMRSILEREHTFGSLRGHRVSIPTRGSIDYVVEPHDAIAAVGEGLLEKLVAGTPPAQPAAIAIDVRPAAMPSAKWKWLLAQLDVKHPDRVVDQLTAWRDAHLGLAVEGQSLVLNLSGTRK